MNGPTTLRFKLALTKNKCEERGWVKKVTG